MRLSAAKFNGLLHGVGQAFLWRRGYACPCITPGSGQPKVSCAHCHGKGRFWAATATDGVAGVGSRDALKKQADFGIWDAGDMLLSIPSDSSLYAMGQYDRLLSVNKTEPFSMNLVYGVNDVLRFAPVSIERVTWLDGGNNLVDGDIPTISADGTLVWGASSPPAKTTYSLTGRRHPEYFVYHELPTDRPHHQGEPLPRRVVVRVFDLFGK
jgi:hypothetical protein